MKEYRTHKSKIEFATRRGINQPITVIIERVPSSHFDSDAKILVEFKGWEFPSYEHADAFCQSTYAKGVLRSTRKYFSK